MSLFHDSAGFWFLFATVVSYIRCLVLYSLRARHNMVAADVNTITYFCDLTRRMRSTVRIRAFGAQDVGPFTAVITEVPRTNPLPTGCNRPAEAIPVVALGTASLVAQEKFSAITADVTVVFMN